MEGIERYEAEQIARDAAISAADDAKRDVGYDVTRVEDDVRRLQRELDTERTERQRAVQEVQSELDELRRTLQMGQG